MILVAGLALALAVQVLSARPERGPEWPLVVLAFVPPVAVLATLTLQGALGGPLASPVWTGLPYDLLPLATSSRGAGVIELGQALLFALALLSGHLVSRGGHGLGALRVFAYAGAAYALLALAFEFAAPDRLLLTEKRAYPGFLTTPFVNRNTAATFYGSVAIVCTLFVARARLGRSMRGIGSLDGIALLAALAALALTGSRAGIVLSLLACLATYMTATRGFSRVRGRLRTPALLVGAVPVLLAVMVLSERVARDSLSGGGRLETYLTTLDMIAERPLLGWGIGTFEHVYPIGRDGPAFGVWDRAHSTPLEWTFEGGIAFAAVMLAVYLLLARRLARLFADARAARRSGDPGEAGMSHRPLAALAVLALGLGHSAIDFSLDITGYLVPFAFVVGLGSASRVARPDRVAVAAAEEPGDAHRRDEGGRDDPRREEHDREEHDPDRHDPDGHDPDGHDPDGRERAGA